MALLSYLNFCTGAAVTTGGSQPITPNQAWGNPALGRQACINNPGGGTTTFDLALTGGPMYPCDVIALLGTTLQYQTDSIGIVVKSGATTLVSHALTPIESDWPESKFRNFVWRIPRQSNGLPQWVDYIRISMTFSGARFFGQGYFGPGFVFGPTRRLAYTYDDSPAKMERNQSSDGWPVEYPVRRFVSIGCDNVSYSDLYTAVQYVPAIVPPPPYVEFQQSLRRMLATYVGKGTQVLLLPIEAPLQYLNENYVSRLAEYCRLVDDPVVSNIAANNFSLTLRVCED